MRSILLFTFLAMLSLASYAQPAGESFPDFTFSDLNGNEHHLQSYLDEGKIVVIDVFATWCGNCQNSVPGIEELYNTLGQAGDQSMVVLSFERDPSTSNEAEYITQYGVESPVITEATELIADTWNITYQPRYFVICPDGSFLSELSTPINSNPQPLIDLADNCETITNITQLDLSQAFALINNTFEHKIVFDSKVARLEYKVIDLTGSVVSNGTMSEGRGEIELNSLPKGMFLLQVNDGRSSLTKRIIKIS